MYLNTFEVFIMFKTFTQSNIKYKECIGHTRYLAFRFVFTADHENYAFCNKIAPGRICYHMKIHSFQQVVSWRIISQKVQTICIALHKK
jgi:hypothetical protein